MTEFSAILNIIGLALDIVGVIVIFHYALPATVDSLDHAIIEHNGDGTPKFIPVRTYQFRARVGLWIFVAGFFFQGLGNATLLPIARAMFN